MVFLCGIGIKTEKRAPLVAADAVHVTIESGMDGDVRGEGGKNRRRQVTVISHNQWREACSDMGWNPNTTSWMLRRAGLCFEGVWFEKRHIGEQVLIGEELLLEITGETEPCSRMDEIAPGLRDVLLPAMRGGVTCRVVCPGSIVVGNHVVIGHLL